MNNCKVCATANPNPTSDFYLFRVHTPLIGTGTGISLPYPYNELLGKPKST